MKMALIDTLSNSLNNYDDTDPNWRQFVDDHKTYLINLSNVATISTSYMQGYRYALRRYLNTIRYNTHCTWIVRLVNNLPSDVQFTDSVNSLLIPPMSVIEDLYTTYLTTQSGAS